MKNIFKCAVIGLYTIPSIASAEISLSDTQAKCIISATAGIYNTKPYYGGYFSIDTDNQRVTNLLVEEGSYEVPASDETSATAWAQVAVNTTEGSVFIGSSYMQREQSTSHGTTIISDPYSGSTETFEHFPHGNTEYIETALKEHQDFVANIKWCLSPGS